MWLNRTRPFDGKGLTGSFLAFIWGALRKVLVLVIGSVTLLVGVVLIVAPGPAMVVIPLGLAILATEFPAVRPASEWCQRLAWKILAWLKECIPVQVLAIYRHDQTAGEVAGKVAEEPNKRGEKPVSIPFPSKTVPPSARRA
jgi:Putative transmembrane protein (PGPGW)